MPQLIPQKMAQQIVEAIKSICDFDINFITEEGVVCASTDPARVGDLHESGRQAALRGEMVLVERDEPLSGIRRGINLPVDYQGRIVAVIGITGDPAEVRRYAMLARRITLLMIREVELERKTADRKARMQYVVHALIRHEPLPAASLQEILTEQKAGEAGGLWRTVLVRSFTPGEHLQNILPEMAVFAAAEQMGRALFAWDYPDQLVMLIPESGKPLDRILARLVSRTQGRLRVGIGSARELRHQHMSFAAAETALKSCRKDRQMVHYDDLDLDMILAEVPEPMRQTYAKKCLQGLTEEDRQLLSVYFSCGMRLKETADTLFLHKNTLQYRLNRVRERCGYDPREFRDAVVLYTAEKLLEE